MFTAVTWQGKDCRFTLHYDTGFSLLDGSAELGNHVTQKPLSAALWRYSFEKLRGSSDDGMRLLWLDFGDDGGEQVRAARDEVTACYVCSH